MLIRHCRLCAGALREPTPWRRGGARAIFAADADVRCRDCFSRFSFADFRHIFFAFRHFADDARRFRFRADSCRFFDFGFHFFSLMLRRFRFRWPAFAMMPPLRFFRRIIADTPFAAAALIIDASQPTFHAISSFAAIAASRFSR